MRLLILTVFFLVVADTAIHAQTCGEACCGSSIVSECDYCQCSQSISPSQTGSTGVRLDVRSLYRGKLYNGSILQSNPENIHETYLTDQIMGFYRFSESDISASLYVPYVSRESFEPLLGIKTSGIGDISVLVHYNYQDMMAELPFMLSTNLGVKLPTGFHEMSLSDGRYIDPHIRAGSGTTDVLVGLSGKIHISDFTIGSSINAGIIAAGGAPDSGGIHKFGNYFTTEISFGYSLFSQPSSGINLSSMITIGGETHAKETLGGDLVTASGETLLYISPGIEYHFSQNISADISIQLPIYQYEGWDSATDEGQLGQNYRIVLGLQYIVR
ncbi:MAG: hypothetical protein WCH46_05845 [bacterium]